MRFRRPSNSKVESEQALEDAKQNLDRIKERTPEVVSKTQKLKNVRVRNHFIEQFEDIFIGRVKPDDT